MSSNIHSSAKLPTASTTPVTSTGVAALRVLVARAMHPGRTVARVPIAPATAMASPHRTINNPSKLMTTMVTTPPQQKSSHLQSRSYPLDRDLWSLLAKDARERHLLGGLPDPVAYIRGGFGHRLDQLPLPGEHAAFPHNLEDPQRGNFEALLDRRALTAPPDGTHMHVVATRHSLCDFLGIGPHPVACHLGSHSRIVPRRGAAPYRRQPGPAEPLLPGRMRCQWCSLIQ